MPPAFHITSNGKTAEIAASGECAAAAIGKIIAAKHAAKPKEGRKRSSFFVGVGAARVRVSTYNRVKYAIYCTCLSESLNAGSHSKHLIQLIRRPAGRIIEAPYPDCSMIERTK